MSHSNNLASCLTYQNLVQKRLRILELLIGRATRLVDQERRVTDPSLRCERLQFFRDTFPPQPHIRVAVGPLLRRRSAPKRQLVFDLPPDIHALGQLPFTQPARANPYDDIPRLPPQTQPPPKPQTN